jgi:predicted Zn finger-like uncharacterized protein
LQHAFEIGMVHRDIKPHNLMLTRKCQVKILDFGLARLASESRQTPGFVSQRTGEGLTQSGTVFGTPDYMAPEQFDDSHKIDIRADLYALGCTLYYLLTGQTPFAKKASAKAKMHAHKFQQPRPITELRPQLPAGLVAVLDKMMAKEPAERYQTPADVVKALTPFAKGDREAKKEGAADAAFNQQNAAIKEPARPAESAGTFLAHCPFCPTRIRVPEKALGASIRCPQCNSYFTAVPESS